MAISIRVALPVNGTLQLAFETLATPLANADLWEVTVVLPDLTASYPI